MNKERTIFSYMKWNIFVEIYDTDISTRPKTGRKQNEPKCAYNITVSEHIFLNTTGATSGAGTALPFRST